MADPVDDPALALAAAYEAVAVNVLAAGAVPPTTQAAAAVGLAPGAVVRDKATGELLEVLSVTSHQNVNRPA